MSSKFGFKVENYYTRGRLLRFTLFF